jgi:HAD superfamily hydrolase (TIGR01484 family)
MRYHVLATDYDGTIARDGRVDDATVAALEAVRRSGRTLLLITGRMLEDLVAAFPRTDVFEWVIAENGAVLHRPSTQETRALAPSPPERFVAMLRERGVAPLAVGRAIVATWEPHQDVVLDAIRTCGLELQVVFNKGAVMVLPSGVNKASGFAAALAEMKRSAHNAVGVGDAENDHAFLAACECSVAVANALPALKEHASWVTVGDHGDGVQELARALIENDLRDLGGCVDRTAVPIGLRPDGSEVILPAYGPPVLIAGASGSGKSMLATRLLEELGDRGYQLCVVDPEGDYGALGGATVVGNPEHAPRVEEALDLLEMPMTSCVLNLLGLPLADRPAFFDRLLPRLQELRARVGRPHWVVADEAHHLFPAAWQPGALTQPEELTGLLAVTVHPDSVSPRLLAKVAVALAVGDDAPATLVRFASAAGVRLPSVALANEAGQVVGWFRAEPAAVVSFRPTPPRGEHRRHVRKYAAGDLGDERSFYFRGPHDRLRLRARNLQTFVELADGVDDETWLHHLRRGDYSQWFRDAIKDDALAEETAGVERAHGLDAGTSRDRIRRAIARRYTAPA